MKLLLTLLFCLCSFLVAPPVLAQTLPQAQIVYQAIQADLDKPGVPLQLPQIIVAPSVNPQLGYGTTLQLSSREGYSLIVGNRTPCGGTPCALAYVEAIRLVPGLPEIPKMFVEPADDPENQPVRSPESASWLKLSNGQTAYFTPWESFLGPGYSHLTWDLGKYRYDIALKVGTRDALVQMAESSF